MGRVISLWGMNGNGKTILSIHTAMEYSRRGHLVGILSCNTAFGYLQRLLGTSISKEKSLSNGLLKPQDHIIKECINHVEKLDIFIISLADEDDVMTLTNVNEEDVENVIITLKNKFDYLIVDGTDRPNDVLVYTAFKQSDHIIEVVKPTLQGMTYHNAHSILINKIIDPQKSDFVLNADQGYIRKSDILDNCIGLPCYEFPYDPSFEEKENIGEIHLVKKKKYLNAIKQFVDYMDEKQGPIKVSNTEETKVKEVEKIAGE
ncbi:MAG: hypothetical protein CVU95_04075 [Firmicutes bacterium HGW-Firmicutes-2]|jgi:hypothetical protein|nr:MAG: hypothetical protein CVU95_04075 [Firmicutes bacterium HGW-Firmicutes-2]